MKIIELIIEHPMISSECDLHMVNFHIYAEENVLGIEWRGLTSKHGETWDYNICEYFHHHQPWVRAKWRT